MEFFTKRHWLGFNSDDPNEADWALKSIDRNFREYAEQLETLRPRLNERNYRFFKNGLHDASLISFSVGDGLHLNVDDGPVVTLRELNRTTVKIKVVNKWFDWIYDLKSGKVSKSVFDFPSDDPLWGNNIDDWGYDEISQVNEKVLRHEILFSSGTTILLEFESFSYSRMKYGGSRY